MQYRKHDENAYRLATIKFAQESQHAKSFAQHEEFLVRQQLRDRIQTKLKAKIQGYQDALEQRRER